MTIITIKGKNYELTIIKGIGRIKRTYRIPSRYHGVQVHHKSRLRWTTTDRDIQPPKGRIKCLMGKIFGGKWNWKNNNN